MRADNLPLSGRTIAVTRAEAQAGPLVEMLESLGAVVLQVPTIVIVDPSDGGVALRSAVAELHRFDWVVLASPNAATYFLRAIHALTAEGSPRLPRIAAVGPGTAETIRALGVSVDLIPQRSIGEGLVEAFPAPPTEVASLSGSVLPTASPGSTVSDDEPTVSTGRVLIPRAAVARDVIPDGLRALGWAVETVEAYRTVPAPVHSDVLEAALNADALAFTSSSTVSSFAAAVRALHEGRLPGTLPIVISIGPATSATAASEGLTIHRTADPHTIAGLVDAVRQALE